MTYLGILHALYLILLLISVVFVAAISATIRGQVPGRRTILVYMKAASDDTLWTIAQRSGVTPQRLYAANPQVADPKKLSAGEDVRVPASGEQLQSRPMPTDLPQTDTVQTPVAVASPPPLPPPQPPAPATPAAAPLGDTTAWDRLAQCESGGHWNENTGNGFYGGLQFTLGTWRSVGGTGLPNQASRAEQIHRGEILQARDGWGPWPACSAKLGL